MKPTDKVDKEIQIYVHNNVSQISDEIDPDFYPIIEDILLRRAYLYGFSYEQVVKDINVLKSWMKRIDLEEIPYARGFFYSPERRIALNVNFLREWLEQENYGEIYRLIAHEMTHALCTDEDGNDILSVRQDGKNKTIFNRILRMHANHANTSLLELIVSELSERLIFSRKEDPKSSVYHSQTVSYPKTSEILELIEAAYGVSEKELMDHAILGRTEMGRFLAEKSGQEVSEVLDTIDMFEIQYTCLHKSIYGMEPRLSDVDLAINTIDLYKLSLKTMNDRIEHTEIHSPEEAKEFCERLEFEYNKLSYLIDSFANKTQATGHWIVLLNVFNGPAIRYLQKNFNEAEFPIARKILKMESVLKDSDKKSEEEIMHSFNSIKNTPPENIEMTEISIDLEKGFLFDINPETLSRFENDDEVEWDNEYILDYIKSVMGRIVEKGAEKIKKDDEELSRKPIIYKFFYILNELFKPLINDIKMIFRRERKLLPSSQKEMSSNQSEHDSFIEGIQVDLPEENKPNTEPTIQNRGRNRRRKRDRSEEERNE